VTYVLWIVQALLALVFLFAGGFKLVTPLDVLYAQMPLPLPGVFVRFVGACEVLGALGLILPGLTRIRPHLTPLAARGLVLIMVGAVMFTPPEDLSLAVLPIVVGLLAAFVAYGRARIAPHAASRRAASARPELGEGRQTLQTA
jgi:DoxX-like family